MAWKRFHGGHLSTIVTLFLVSLVEFTAQPLYAMDVECSFIGEPRPTLYKGLVSGENISLQGGSGDEVQKKEIYWGDDYLTIIVETTGMATLVVINRKTLDATKRVTRAGISRGEARGWCKILKAED